MPSRLPIATLRAFLAGVPEPLRDTVVALRELVLSAAGPVEESVVWRSLSYHRPEIGGRVKGAVCLITPKSRYVELGFIHGSALPDPRGLLVAGTATHKRVVRVGPEGRIENPRALAALVRAATTTRTY